MNLSTTTEKLELVLTGTITTNQLMWYSSYSTLTAGGLNVPKSSSQGLTNNTNAVELVPSPSSNLTRVVNTIMVFNSDSVAAQVIIKKDVSGTEYTIIKAILQSNDTLQYTEGSGWSIVKQSSQESVILREYTSNSTWTKPQGLSRVLIAVLGGGGGGGAGRRGATTTNRYGGGGGGGGAIVYRQISNDGLLGSYPITIGTGGTGGTGITADDTNGNSGSAGGDTSFGSVVVAKGGTGGTGGTAIAGSSGAGGSNITSIPAYSPYALSGASGGTGSQANGTAGTAGFASTGSPGGGGGGGISNGNASSTTGGAGGGVYWNGILQAGASSGASPNGGDNRSTSVMLSTSLTSTIGLGTGGAGGYHTSYPTFINGGNGGLYGAGGGGGSASLNGNISGAGGSGASGMCLVMEFY